MRVRYVHIPRVHLFPDDGRTDGDVTSMGVLACGFCEKGHRAFQLLGRHICPSAPVFVFALWEFDVKYNFPSDINCV